MNRCFYFPFTYKEYLSSQIKELKQKSSLTDREQLILQRLKTEKQNLKRPFRGSEELLLEPTSKDPRLNINNLICGTIISSNDTQLYSTFIAHALSPTEKAKEVARGIRQQLDDIKFKHPLIPAPIAPANSDLPPLIHIKNDLCRLPQAVIGALAVHHNISDLSTIDRITALKEKGVLKENLANKLIKTMELVFAWRIKMQLAYKSEFDAFEPNPAATTAFKTKIPDYQAKINQEIASIIPEVINLEQKLVQFEQTTQSITNPSISTAGKTPAPIETIDDAWKRGIRMGGRLNKLKESIETLKSTDLQTAQQLELEHQEITNARHTFPPKVIPVLVTRDLLKDCQSEKGPLEKIESQKSPVFSKKDLEDFQTIVRPTLWELYTLTKNSYNEKNETIDFDTFK